MSNESGPEGGTPSPQPSADGSRIDDAFADDPAVRDHPRYQQMFPVLTDGEVDKVRRFGSLSRRFSDPSNLAFAARIVPSKVAYQ
jgi:thioredoxin reductase (NADPH)